VPFRPPSWILQRNPNFIGKFGQANFQEATNTQPMRPETNTIVLLFTTKFSSAQKLPVRVLSGKKKSNNNFYKKKEELKNLNEKEYVMRSKTSRNQLYGKREEQAKKASSSQNKKNWHNSVTFLTQKGVFNVIMVTVSEFYFWKIKMFLPFASQLLNIRHVWSIKN